MAEPFRKLTAAELQGAHLLRKERTWQGMRFDAIQFFPNDHELKPGVKVGKFYPEGFYISKLIGVRSDGVECRVTLNIDARWFKRPAKFMEHLAGMFQQLQTYRDCECVGPSKDGPGKLCLYHGQSMQTLQETLTADTNVKPPVPETPQ